MNDIKFGKYLKRVRKKYNFSKEYVANILKVKESLVSDWESGRLTLNDEYMEKLSLFYGVNLYKKRSKNITMEVIIMIIIFLVLSFIPVIKSIKDDNEIRLTCHEDDNKCYVNFGGKEFKLKLQSVDDNEKIVMPDVEFSNIVQMSDMTLVDMIKNKSVFYVFNQKWHRRVK